MTGQAHGSSLFEGERSIKLQANRDQAKQLNRNIDCREVLVEIGQ